MTLFEKAVYTVAVAAFFLIFGLGGAYWWAGTVPGRPRGVTENAVFLWAPHVGIPGPRRGWWVACWEVAAQNRCKITGVDGSPEYEGEFVPYGHNGALSADHLEIDAAKTQDHKLWVGDALVPLIYLRSGEVLVPASKYEEGKRLLEQLKPSK